MQTRTVLVLGLAVICAGSAAVGMNQLMRQMEAQSKLDTTTVLVVTQDVPRGGVLREEMITVREWPTKLVPAGVVTDVSKVKDRTVSVSMVKDEPILARKLIEGGMHGSLAGMIPPGMRAFTISTPHRSSGVGGFIEPGNRVDVLLTTTSQVVDGSGGGSTTTLLQNIPILAVDEHLDTLDEKKGAQRQDVKTVTLLVTPDQANKLSLADNKGSLNLSLRHPDDEADANTAPATMADLRLYRESARNSRTALVFQQVAQAVVTGLATARPSPSATASEEVQSVVANPTTPMSFIRTLRGTQSGLVRVQN